MSGINLGNVVGLLVSATAPTKKYVIWAKPNPSNDDDYTLFKYDAIASEWKPYDVDRSYFLPAVIAMGTNTLPSSPNLEDAYLIGDTPTGIAVGHAQEHALWNGYSWIFIEPKEGASCRSKTDPNATYVFNSGEWLLSSIAVTGYIPTTGTVPGYDISGDLVTEDTTLVKFGRDFTATGGSQGSWFEVQHGGGAGTIGMYSRGLGLGFTAGITVNYSGGVFIDAHNATITANNQLKLYSTAQDLWLSAANNDILMFAKNLKLPTRTTADRGTGNGYIAYNTDTNKYEGYIGGTWKDFVLGSDALPISGGTLTGFLTLHADPTNAMHAATKGYVDNAITGLNWKYAVRVATVSNITLSGTQTVDGVLVSVGDRVLVKNQSTATENGIYLVAAGAWTRTTDADTGAEIVTAAVLITTGTQANTQWTCTNSTPPTIGTTAITFGQIAGAGVYTNGTGIALSGNAFSLDLTRVATSSVTGLLSASDWTTFNSKFNTPTGLGTNRLVRWNGTQFIDSILTDNGTLVSFDTVANNSRVTFSSASNNADVSLFSTSNTIRFFNYLAVQFGGITATVSGTTIDTAGSAFVRIRSGGNDGRQVYVDASMNYYANTTHQFVNQSGTNVASISINGLALGSATINPLTQLDLQSTTKGLGLNGVAGDLGTTRNGLIWYDTIANQFKGIANATVRTIAFAGDTYKFDELLQLTDCNATFATANTVVYMAFIPKGDIAVTKIYYNLQSAGTDTVRVGIYADASNSPTTLIVQANEATTGATTTGHRSITISTTNLTAGTRYWIAIKNDNGASSFLSKDNVYSNNITKESSTSGVLVASPTTYSALNAVWMGIGV